jgi:hypothetical protein
MVIAQDLRLEFRGNGHGEDLCEGSRSAAESRGGRVPGSAGRSNDSAIARIAICPSARPPPPRSGPADHRGTRTGNPDASRYLRAADTAAPAPHAQSDRGGSPDNGGRPRARTGGAPPVHNRPCNRSGRGRTGCRSPPGHGNGRTERTGPAAAPRPRGGVDAPPRRGHNPRAFVPRTVQGTAPRLTVRLRSAPCLSPDRIWSYRTRCRRSAQRRRRGARRPRVAQVGKQATPHARRSVAREGTARRARVPPVRYLDNPLPVARRVISISPQSRGFSSPSTGDGVRPRAT